MFARVTFDRFRLWSLYADGIIPAAAPKLPAILAAGSFEEATI